MWKLYHKEDWMPNNWCFWSVVLEKTLESPLDCKEIQPVNPNRNQPWKFIGRADAPMLWPPDAKSQLVGKDPDAGKERGQEKGLTEDEIIGWHHRLNGHEFKQTQGNSEGEGILPCCSLWGLKELDTSEWLNNKSCKYLLEWQALGRGCVIYLFIFACHPQVDSPKQRHFSLTVRQRGRVFWGRPLRVPWTARRSKQSTLKEISPEYSLEGLMLKLKLQYFGHLMGRTDSLERTLMLGRIEGGRRRGWQRMRWLDGITDWMDTSLSKL